jgi:hypothetical protein
MEIRETDGGLLIAIIAAVGFATLIGAYKILQNRS